MPDKISKKLIEELYCEENNFMVNGKPWDIPEKGSLGVLALGYKGIIAWRKKRKELENSSDNLTANETK